MPVTTDYLKFKTYTASQYPTMEGGENTYFTKEFNRIEASLASCKAVIKTLEARLAAIGG